jgi:hypothetical protein
MQDSGYGLPRTPLLGISVHKPRDKQATVVLCGYPKNMALPYSKRESNRRATRTRMTTTSM